MKIDISKFEEIKPTRGGKSSATFSLGRQGYFMGNGVYLEDDKEFKSASSVDMRAMKEENKVVVLINFITGKEGAFSINEFKNDKGEIKRKSFSARSVFKQLDLSYKNFAQEKAIKLKPRKEEVDGITYTVVEIPIK